jgi:lipopolysaccharide/colanic/teichoic acid biosynthesis glycosyltransferase
LVGPRPPLPHEVATYDERQMRRLEVNPGMTGIWQISGRSDLSFDEMVMMDIHYVENWSLGLDVTILLRTLAAVLARHGAY